MHIWNYSKTVLLTVDFYCYTHVKILNIGSTKETEQQDLMECESISSKNVKNNVLHENEKDISESNKVRLKIQTKLLLKT